MTPATALTDATAATAEELSTRNGEPAWLRERRIEAWRAYAAMGLPDEKDEEWRRTDVRAVSFDGLAVAAGGETAWTLPYDPRDTISPTGAIAHLAQVNGGRAFLGRADDLPEGVILLDLHTAAREHEDLVRKHLYATVGDAEWKYLSLNAALWSGGAFLYVPDGIELALPIEVMQALTGERQALFPRTLIIAGRNSRVSVIDETYSSDGAAALVSGAVEISIGDGAAVEYYSVNRWGDAVQNFSTVRATLGRDARFTGTVAGIGSKLTKMRIDAEMEGAGSDVRLIGVTFGDGGQHFDYNTLQNHTGKSTISDLQFKSALTDSASLVWYGITRINHSAGGSEANQTSRNLLLSEHAKAAPIPILEIQAHDVAKCSHGATAGPVDEDQLYYLQARAIRREDAERMLIEGFFADVLDRIPSVQVRERVMSAVLDKIGGGIERLTLDEVLGTGD